MAQSIASAAGTSGVQQTPPKYTTRGNKKPIDSPPDLLTDDRTGGEGSSILVSPKSYGRTRAAAAKAAIDAVDVNVKTE